MTTPLLTLQDMFLAQAEAYYTINENNRALEAVAVGVLQSVSLSAAPATPNNGYLYHVSGTPTSGDPWEGQGGKLALYDTNAWWFYTVPNNYVAWIADEVRLARWNGSTWLDASASTGKTYINPATATYTLTTSEAAKSTIMIDGSVVTTVEFPVDDGKVWQIINNSSNDVSVKTTSGAGTVLVFSGKKSFVVCDGTNLIPSLDSFPYGFKMGGTLELPVYSTASAPASANFGAIIFVSDGNSGSPCLAAWDGGSWKRISLGTTISSV